LHSAFFYGYRMDPIKTRTSLLFIVFVVLGVYYPVIFSPLNPIDDVGISNYLLNTDVTSIGELFTHVGSANYHRPVLWLTFWLDKYLWGIEESFMHLENVILHLFNTLLLFAIARKAALLQGIRSTTIPFISALFFAIHPINTEPVNWIAGRSDVLAAFFVLLSLLLLLSWPDRWTGSFIAAISLLIGCFAKESAIFFLPMALAAPFFISSDKHNRQSFKHIFLHYKFHFFIFFITGLGFFALRSLAMGHGDKGISTILSHVTGGQGDDFLVKLQVVLKASGYYLKKLFVPFPLNFGIVHVSDLYLLLGLLFLVILAWLMTKRTMATFFFLSAAAVASSALLVSLLKSTWTPLAERYMYMPSAFFVVGITLVGYSLTARTSYRVFVSSLVVVIFLVAVYGTVNRTLLWQDNNALFADTLLKSPGFRPIQTQVMNNYLAKGEKEQAIALAASIDVSEEFPDFQFGLLSRASALAQSGDFYGARDLYEKALLNPGDYEMMLLRGLLSLYDARIIAVLQGRDSLIAAKVPLINRLYDLTGDAFYLYRLGQAYLQLKDSGAARDVFSRCAKLAPHSAHYRQAVLILSQQLAKSEE